MSKKRHIEIIARGVCVMGGKLLLCHAKGKWNTYLPGGHVEFKEMVRRGLEREILEETGLKAKAGRFLGAVEHTFKQEGERHCEINLVFEFSVPGLRPDRAPKSCEDHIEFLWAPLSLLRRHAVEPAVLRRFVPRWLAEARGAPRWTSTYAPAGAGD